MALWGLRLFSPVVAPDPPNGLIMDVTGGAHLRGGERPLLEHILERLRAVGISAKAAMADTWGAAHAVARHGSEEMAVVPRGAGGHAIADLPVRLLRLPPDMVDALARLGFDCISELEAKPRAPLALRFGPELIRRLDQAYGRLAEVIDPVETPELIQVRRVFAEPIGAPETLARYTLKLTEQLCAALETKGLGARKFDLRFYRVDNRIEAVRIGTAKPVREVTRVARLLCDKLEQVDPGFGIEAMVLALPWWNRSTGGLRPAISLHRPSPMSPTWWTRSPTG